ncbi:MAG: DUF3833 domain-containing protein [Gammaproteobacteria bacterium]|jgi:hypothetical protein
MLKRSKASLLSICMLFTASGCSVTPEEYENSVPVFDMKTYFNGDLQAWGLFQDYRGKVTRRFHVTLTGTWTGNQGVLDEVFTYADGTTQRRTWKLTRVDEHTFTGTAADVIGEATGTAHGFAFRWQYVLALKVEESVYHVSFDDWMWLIDDNTVVNYSAMSKYGVTLGNVLLVFRKTRGNARPNRKLPEIDTEIHRKKFDMPEVHHIVLNRSAVI